jgi:hypothetical protein
MPQIIAYLIKNATFVTVWARFKTRMEISGVPTGRARKVIFVVRRNLTTKITQRKGICMITPLPNGACFCPEVETHPCEGFAREGFTV